MQSARSALFPGSFDPITSGHLDLIERARAIFDEVVVAVGRHATRQPLFTLDERIAMLTEVTAKWPGVRIASYDGLLIDFAASVGAIAVVRGLRSGTDLDYEMPIAHANHGMKPAIDTLFFPTRAGLSFVSASIVREIAAHGGPVNGLVPPPVARALEKKFPSLKAQS